MSRRLNHWLVLLNVEFVRLITSEGGGESLWNEEPGFLARSGVEVRIVNDLYIHAKAILVDAATLWVGSQNLTANSLDNNRELGIFVDDQHSVSRAIRTFESDFAAGEMLKPASNVPSSEIDAAWIHFVASPVPAAPDFAVR